MLDMQRWAGTGQGRILSNTDDSARVHQACSDLRQLHPPSIEDHRTRAKPMTRVGSLFAGVGGFDIAAERAGFQVAFQVEIDKSASKVLENHWPDVPRFADVGEVTFNDKSERPHRVPDVDVLAGGFPCQDYSMAGNREGLAGDRGALWWQFHRLIDEGRPEWIVGENVPGLLSSRDGRDFATIVQSLANIGYGVVWRVLDARYFGVPQRRRRVFIVGHSGGIPRPEVLAITEGLLGDTRSSAETKSVSSALTRSGVGGGGGADDNAAQAGHLIPMGAPVEAINQFRTWQRTPIDGGEMHIADYAAPLMAFDGNGPNPDNAKRNLLPAVMSVNATASDPSHGEDESPTVVAGGYHGVTQAYDELNDSVGDIHQTLRATGKISTGLLNDLRVRRLTPVETERLQGFPDGWTAGQSDSSRFRQMGNAVAVPVVEWIMKRIAAQGD